MSQVNPFSSFQEQVSSSVGTPATSKAPLGKPNLHFGHNVLSHSEYEESQDEETRAAYQKAAQLKEVAEKLNREIEAVQQLLKAK